MNTCKIKMQKPHMKHLDSRALVMLVLFFGWGYKIVEVFRGMLTTDLTCLSHNTYYKYVSSHGLLKAKQHECKLKQWVETGSELNVGVCSLWLVFFFAHFKLMHSLGSLSGLSLNLISSQICNVVTMVWKNNKGSVGLIFHKCCIIHLPSKLTTCFGVHIPSICTWPAMHYVRWHVDAVQTRVYLYCFTFLHHINASLDICH